ncbi:cation:proton antiporter [Mariprofundus erugo]|uniref:Cation:proton antiporter n=1 Tax=Mariprofundus erugo TaxID=2528639 RepID=A0A5R9GMP4_9PROT|nr:cation:proton antiporter [Mariprofundus erugo]TLS67641.1 cation:proton antiporter [Mariprofundus erugo]TLS73848.1 cation:proton antiporter [Mariprofundus erugo]
MDINYVLLALVAVIGCAMLFAFVLRSMRIPAAIAYIITGVIVGPSGLGMVNDRELMTHMGDLGVIMLLFFIGMEVSLPRLIDGWRIALVGTLAQILLSVAVCIGGAWLFGSTWKEGLLFGFLISMSSTAVVLTLLKDADELDLPFGQNALGILLVQDMAIVPMMIVLGVVGGEGDVEPLTIAMQVVGGTLLLALAVWLMRRPGWRFPGVLKQSLDSKIMLGLLLCFSAAALTAEIGLSAPFGAFLAGMILHASDQSEWVEEHLRSLYVVFVAIFFMSVGMLVSLDFVSQHLLMLMAMTLLVFIVNSGINAVILRILGETWAMALLTGGLLSQIGEFSFLLASMGLGFGLLSEDGHQMAMAVIALSLMFSPLWMLAVRLMLHEETQVMENPGQEASMRERAHQTLLEKEHRQ